jgi:hypothetical protein
LILEDNFRLSSSLAKYILSLKGDIMNESVRQMIIVNLASAQKHNGEEQAALDTVASCDWSASSDDFRLCVASIQGDIGLAVQLFKSVSTSGKIGKDAFRDWPVLSFLRNEKEFQAAFEAHFSEPLDLISNSEGAS